MPPARHRFPLTSSSQSADQASPSRDAPFHRTPPHTPAASLEILAPPLVESAPLLAANPSPPSRGRTAPGAAGCRDLETLPQSGSLRSDCSFAGRQIRCVPSAEILRRWRALASAEWPTHSSVNLRFL